MSTQHEQEAFATTLKRGGKLLQDDNDETNEFLGKVLFKAGEHMHERIDAGEEPSTNKHNEEPTSMTGTITHRFKSTVKESLGLLQKADTDPAVTDLKERLRKADDMDEALHVAMRAVANDDVDVETAKRLLRQLEPIDDDESGSNAPEELVSDETSEEMVPATNGAGEHGQLKGKSTGVEQKSVAESLGIKQKYEDDPLLASLGLSRSTRRGLDPERQLRDRRQSMDPMMEDEFDALVKKADEDSDRETGSGKGPTVRESLGLK